ncbi:HCO3 transporter family-domain-containing protein [Dipodascopsis tothii]|uniref:HCO3 transporter family-domain-containing protein n=1 Tax=Dipodascopsis tothii TaxID=44089 RepID=UPI0034CFFDD4
MLSRTGRLLQQLRPFAGIVHDIKGRLPYYRKDWTTDAMNYRIVPATVYMYFANLLPAIAFALDMFEKTNNSYGVNEVLLASVVGSFLFSVLAGQPLCIVGVTGPIAVFNSTVYKIIHARGTLYFPFMAWVCLWSMVMHILIAVFNGVAGLKYITRFSCDTFGFYVSFVYLQKGIQVSSSQFSSSRTSGYMSVMTSLLTLISGWVANHVGEKSELFHRLVRRFISDYGTPLVVVFYSGFVHFGKMEEQTIKVLPTTKAFQPTLSSANPETAALALIERPHGWFIHFWDGITVGDVFLALPFALLLTILFYFDHNVSSIICQDKQYPLKKPPAFHWDFLLLGITTGLAGILGLPAPNGLIPQAPFHTASLCVTHQVKRVRKSLVERQDFAGSPRGSRAGSRPGSGAPSGGSTPGDMERGGHRSYEFEEYEEVEVVIDKVIEQRVSNAAQGLLILGTMSGPLLKVLNQVPQSVLAGLFWIMGLGALRTNGIVTKMHYLFQDQTLVKSRNPLRKIRRVAVFLFTSCELIAFGLTFAITQTIAAVGFPAILLLFAAFATILPKFFTSDELSVLDSPTASEMTMASMTAYLRPKHDDSVDDTEDHELRNKSHATGTTRSEKKYVLPELDLDP